MGSRRLFSETELIRNRKNVRFEVLDEKFIVKCGVLEMSNGNGFTRGGESRSGFLKGRQLIGSEPLSLAIEVYVTGSFVKTPIVLTKTLKLGLPKKKKKKQNKKGMLDSRTELISTEERG
ncbi:hypothetical protein U1Q18_014881 [Sarracenia purpurea var. burkii]